MRKKLWVVAIILFVFGIIDMKLMSSNNLHRSITTYGGAQTQTVIPEEQASSIVDSESDVQTYEISTEPLFEGNKERFVAHRGYSNVAPENTSVAFELAGRSGFWGIESDIIETADGVFMCMHDDTVDRTTNGTGKAAEMSYDQISELKIDGGNNVAQYPDLHVPTFIEYLNTCVIYDCVPVIEIKSIKNYDTFLETIYNSGLQDRCIITGGIEDLREIRARNNSIPIMVIGYSNKDYGFYTNLMKEFPDNSGILYNYPVVTQAVVDELHSKNMYCGVWSLDTAEEAEKFISYGVDYVVTNDIPGGLNHMINENE